MLATNIHRHSPIPGRVHHKYKSFYHPYIPPQNLDSALQRKDQGSSQVVSVAIAAIIQGLLASGHIN